MVKAEATGPLVDAASLRGREIRAAFLGGVATCGGFALMVAGLGFFGLAVANQSLLANLALHAAALAAATFLVVAAAGWRAVGMLGVAAAVATAALHVERVRWTPVAPVPAAAGRLELLHVNVLGDNPRGGEMAQAIAASGADVVVVLEAAGVRDHLAVLDAAYPHRFGCDAADCDMMILSRVALEEPRWLPLPHAQQRFATAVLRVGGQPVRIVAVHFIKDFFAGLRISQAWAVWRHIGRAARREGVPTVLTGDFNAAPWDPTVRFLTRLMRLRHPAAWLPTWPVALGPAGVPIDHVLVSDALRFERIARTPAHGSNHFGLRATIVPAP